MGRASRKIDTRTVCRQANRLGGIVGVRHASDTVRADVASLVRAQLFPCSIAPALVASAPKHRRVGGESRLDEFHQTHPRLVGDGVEVVQSLRGSNRCAIEAL